MFSFHFWVVNYKLSQPLLHLWIKGFSSTLFFLNLFCMKPSEDILRMNVKLSCFGSNNFGQSSIRLLVQFFNSLDEFSFKINSITPVGYGSFSFLILFVFTFSFYIFIELTEIELGSFFNDFLVDPIKFELTQHYDWVGIFEPFELRSILLDSCYD